MTKLNHFYLVVFVLLFVLSSCTPKEASNNADNEENSQVVEQNEDVQIENTQKDVTTEFLKLCEEIWADDEYNAAKFKVENEKFIDNYVILSDEIKYISENGRVAIDIKHLAGEWDTKEITCWFDFEEPEKVMDLKNGQQIKIKGVYEKGERDIMEVLQYDFNFKNPEIIQ